MIHHHVEELVHEKLNSKYLLNDDDDGHHPCRIELLDFLIPSKTSNSEPCLIPFQQQLKKKMMRCRKKIPRPFSTNFHLSHSFKMDDCYGVVMAISRNHNCLFISCDLNRKGFINVYNLKTFELMTSIKISCSSLCVEENYDHDGHDALIVFDSFCLTIQKFNLQQVLEWSSTCNENLPPHIWQIDESGGKMAIFENELLVDQFFRQEIDIYNLNNGTLITSISIENHFLNTSVCTCTAMAINEYTRELIICETYYTAGRIEGPYKKLQFFRKDLHNKWKHVKTVDKRAKFHCEEPLCMIWDRTAKHLLFGNWHSIFAFSLDGELVSTISPQGFQGSSRCFGCHSMALNDETGELVVLGNQWVLIFQ